MRLRHLYPALAMAAAAAAAMSMLAGCGSSHGRAAHRGAAAQAGATRPSRGPAPGYGNGLAAAPPGLADRLVLSRTSVIAGTPIKATLIVTNSGRAPVNLTHGCRPYFAVVLTNHRFPPDVAVATDCSVKPFIVAPGRNRLAVTIITSYQACTQAPGQATRRLPACTPAGPPPLPAGRYEAVLVGSGALQLPAPGPVPVLLTAPPATH